MELITKQKAAGILGVTVRTLNNLIAADELPQPKKIGRRVYWIKDEFEGFLRTRLSCAAECGDPEI